jgi:hypothetical protein
MIRTRQDGTIQDMRGQGTTGPHDRTGQSMIGLDRTGRDGTGQDRTGWGQDRT